MNLEDSIENILDIVNECLEKEKNDPNGLLSHVKTIIPEYNNERGVEAPAIWIVQHTVSRKGNDNLSQELLLMFTIEFVCVEWDKTPKIAEKKARRLATKVAESIKRNYRRIQIEKNLYIIENVLFNTLYPVGEIEVEGKTTKTPVSGLVLDFEFNIDWNNRC